MGVLVATLPIPLPIATIGIGAIFGYLDGDIGDEDVFFVIEGVE